MRFAVLAVGLFIMLPALSDAAPPSRQSRSPRTRSAMAPPSRTTRQVQPSTVTIGQDTTEAAMSQRINGVQQGLEREAKMLQARMAQLDRMRQPAIQKGDNELLKKIEAMESAAVKGYEARVQQILSGIAPRANRPAAARSRAGSTKRRKSQPSTIGRYRFRSARRR